MKNKTRSLVPKNVTERIVRIMNIASSFLQDSIFRRDAKIGLLNGWKKVLARTSGIGLLDVNDLVNWNDLELRLCSPTSNAGQVSHLELLSIIGVLKSFLKPGQNFLEIGTFDGNTALNVAVNIPIESKVITIDLPEDNVLGAKFAYDNLLIGSESRKKKKHLKLKNVEQIYHDSTTLDFSKFDFHAAFIDGGHDYQTVKMDTLNVIGNIKRPGIIFWHDYDVECEIGDLLHDYATQYPIQWIKETRLAFLRLE